MSIGTQKLLNSYFSDLHKQAADASTNNVDIAAEVDQVMRDMDAKERMRQNVGLGVTAISKGLGLMKSPEKTLNDMATRARHSRDMAGVGNIVQNSGGVTIPSPTASNIAANMVGHRNAFTADPMTIGEQIGYFRGYPTPAEMQESIEQGEAIDRAIAQNDASLAMRNYIGGGAGALIGGGALGGLAYMLAPEKKKRLYAAIAALAGAGLGGYAGYKIAQP